MFVCETWSGAKALSWIEVLYSRVLLRNVTYMFVTMTYMGKITNIDKDVSVVRIFRTQHCVSEATCFRPRAKTLIQRNSLPSFNVSSTVHARYNRVKRNQPDAQLIHSIFRQLLHVSGVSRPIIRRYNRMYTTIGTYYSF